MDWLLLDTLDSVISLALVLLVIELVSSDFHSVIVLLSMSYVVCYIMPVGSSLLDSICIWIGTSISGL